MTDGTGSTAGVTSDSLVVVAGEAKGTVIPIPFGELLLGREAGEPGRLGGDRILSRRHARVTRDLDGRLLLEDLGSTNGTLLNGARVAGRQVLHARDVIEVGGSRLEVVVAAADARGHARQVEFGDDSQEWLGYVLPPPGRPMPGGARTSAGAAAGFDDRPAEPEPNYRPATPGKRSFKKGLAVLLVIVAAMIAGFIATAVIAGNQFQAP